MASIDPVPVSPDTEASRQFRPLVDQNLSIVFYDLTTVRIHGEAEVADDLRAFAGSRMLRGLLVQEAQVRHFGSDFTVVSLSR